jgi:hypothetical protein
MAKPVAVDVDKHGMECSRMSPVCPTLEVGPGTKILGTFWGRLEKREFLETCPQFDSSVNLSPIHQQTRRWIWRIWAQGKIRWIAQIASSSIPFFLDLTALCR